MGEMINEIIKKLKPKEKIAIIVSMSALAVLLLTLVILLAFCGADKHKHVYDCYLEKVDTGFNLVGKCNVFGCQDPHYLVKGVNPAVESTTEATCGVDGEIVYVYTEKGNTGRYIEKIKATGNHYFNGTLTEELLNEDGALDSSLPGVKPTMEIAYVCGDIIDGFYQCSSCNIPVLVPIYRDHIGVNTTVSFPDCENHGEVQQICKYCSVEIGDPIATEPLGHAYVFEIQQKGGKSNLVGTCQRANCQNPDYLEENVTDLKEISKTESTCASLGVTVYQYVNKNGETVQISIVSDGKPNHVICGVDATTLADENGYYDYKQEGIKMFAGRVAECGKLTNAYYICEECSQTVLVKVTKPGHTMKLDYSTVKNPTALTTGSIAYRCHNDDCTASLTIQLPVINLDKNAEIIDDATATTDAIVKYTYDTEFGETVELQLSLSTNHDHVYSYSLDDKGDKINLVGKCVVAGCPTPDYLEENVTDIKLVSEISATCLNGKISRYTCVSSSGRTLSFEIVDGEPTGDHILNGVLAEGTEVVQVNDNGTLITVKAFKYGKNGISLFSSQTIEAGTTVRGYFKCERCGKTVLVWVYIPKDYQP